jgi:hypothetical protein
MSHFPTRLSLSAKGLQRLESVNHERDFTFIVGNERYFCPSFVAEFLSPRISSLRSQDITIDEFFIQTEDSNHQFESLLSLGLGCELSHSGKGLAFVRSVCGELWNHELFEQTFTHNKGEITEEELKARVEFLSGLDGTCGFDIPAVASHFHRFSVSDFDHLSRSVVESILSDGSLVVRYEDSVFDVVHRLASSDDSYFGLLEFVRFEFVSVDCIARAFEFISNSFESLTLGIWSSLGRRLTLPVTPPASPSGRLALAKALPPIDSKIISTIPDIFGLSPGQRLQLLYRGSRDGFEGSTFHLRCDGHPNTISLILSKNDCIFGGFTPIAWSSRGTAVPDPSLKSFIFTLKNPHDLSARIFKQKQAEYAIFDYGVYGPTFGHTADLFVCEQCRRATNSYSHVGNDYVNDTGISAGKVLTGSDTFTVEEIEVFKVV